MLAVISQLPRVTAVALVINGTNPRLRADLVHTFQQLRGLLPGTVWENTLAIITKCTIATRYLTCSKAAMLGCMLL